MYLISKQIKTKLSMELIDTLWQFYQEGYPDCKEKDAYQLFMIQRSNIIMWQEVSESKKIVRCDSMTENDMEVWIIFDDKNYTMMFPENY
ncbi:hypothetical protein V1268_000722 [Enterococcus hirae]|uniref:DUF960 family protein n=1 Tax=Enterococcus TaxID=1350 RepID=UPI000BBBE6A5|nr:DUF960 family protein [Enterococcus hirae]EMF0260462.1 hypothetical protein [Enterococcus hirae]EMF0287334.1 hypothetical protein [Enterococcus hirae]MDU1931486.1 DUF960 family protein [Enterococcus hirae]PCE00918.1 hypothetical protein CKY11_08090 [Enterococcus hirae]QKX70518.1 hypothetical protein HU257_02210 [Enterococcus hirae]